MPKILPNQRRQFLDDARLILRRQGYQALSIRRLAAASGVATGTLYNYFRGKQELVAAIMLDDWRRTQAAMAACGSSADDLAGGLIGLKDCLVRFIDTYRPTWIQSGGTGAVGGAIDSRHGQLIVQVAEAITQLLGRTAAGGGLEQLAPLLAETLLAIALHPGTQDDMRLRQLAVSIQPGAPRPAERDGICR